MTTASGKPLSDVMEAWAAGLFEGEGCARFNSTVPSLQLVTTDRDVIDRFAAVIGYGSISYQEPRFAHWKIQWRWTAATGDEVEEIIGRLWPYLGSRRRAQVMETLRQYDLHLHARMLERLKVCEVCGSRFLTRRRSVARWCSQRCRATYRRRKLAEAAN